MNQSYMRWNQAICNSLSRVTSNTKAVTPRPSKFGETSNDAGAPSQLPRRDEIDFEEFQRQQNDERNDENEQRRPRRQAFDQRAPA